MADVDLMTNTAPKFKLQRAIKAQELSIKNRLLSILDDYGFVSTFVGYGSFMNLANNPCLL